MRFLMVDRIVACEPGRSAKGLKCVTLESDVFEHHFPAVPVMPGVLVVESLAQTAGYLLEKTSERSDRRVLLVLRSIVRANFVHPVLPGDVLDLTVELVDMEPNAARVRGEARVEDRVAARVEMTFGLTDADPTSHAAVLAARQEARSILERRSFPARA
jgi:3-hydroxyacyl-[acyl-carrier-protein] dehydratase